MNKKGQISVGGILVIAIGVIVALVLLQASSSGIGIATKSVTYNATVTAPDVLVYKDLTGQELLDTPLVLNGTTIETVNSANYTIAERVSTVDGLKRIALYMPANSLWANKSINISYSYGSEGYIADSGSRGVAGLILILAAVALICFILWFILKEKGVFD